MVTSSFNAAASPWELGQQLIAEVNKFFGMDVRKIGKLIDAGADLGARYSEAGHEGFTALMYAAMQGHEDVTRLLLDGGANPDDQSYTGHTALMLALKVNRWKIAEGLIDRGAAVNLRTKLDETALMMAAVNGLSYSVGGLLERGADVLCKTQYGMTAADLALREGHADVVFMLSGAADRQRARDAWISSGMPAGQDVAVSKPLRFKAATVQP